MGGGEIEWPYIDKDMVCVMAKGKTILSTGGGGSPSSLARTHSWKTTKPQEAEHKTAVVGEGHAAAAEAEGYPVPQGGGGGRAMTSISC